MCFKCIFKKNNIIFFLILIFISVIFERVNLNNKLSTTYSQKPSLVISLPVNPSNNFKNNLEIYKVKKVIDGDTILLETNKKVRYIGIDTPELHDPRKKIECFAQEAYLENKKLVEGKMVRLEKDVSENDKYNRLLRYVYLLKENSTQSALFINEYLVKEGFAYAVSYPPDIKYTETFLKAQKYAQENNKGLWKSCSFTFKKQ